MTILRASLCAVVICGCGPSPPVRRVLPVHRPALMALPTSMSLGCSAALADPSGERAIDLVADPLHTCARTASGAVACWGREDGGQLELCEGNHAARPVRLPFDGATQVATSLAGTCAIVDARVSCTSGVHRAIGRPRAVGNGELATLAGALRVAVGDYHVCAIVGDEVVCLASKRDGPSHSVVGPAPQHAADADYDAGLIPIAHPKLVSAGPGMSCATDAAGAVWCWGDSGMGALGVPGLTRTTQPVRVGAFTGTTAVVTKGWATCAITRDGAAYCWGGRFGEKPRRLAFADVHHLAIGDEYACAVDTAGRVICEGDTQDILKAGVPAFGGPVVQLASGGGHLCARLADGTVECVGTAGYLGNDEPLPNIEPSGVAHVTCVFSPVRALGPARAVP